MWDGRQLGQANKTTAVVEHGWSGASTGVMYQTRYTTVIKHIPTLLIKSYGLPLD